MWYLYEAYKRSSVILHMVRKIYVLVCMWNIRGVFFTCLVREDMTDDLKLTIYYDNLPVVLKLLIVLRPLSHTNQFLRTRIRTLWRCLDLFGCMWWHCTACIDIPELIGVWGNIVKLNSLALWAHHLIVWNQGTQSDKDTHTNLFLYKQTLFYVPNPVIPTLLPSLPTSPWHVDCTEVATGNCLLGVSLYSFRIFTRGNSITVGLTKIQVCLRTKIIYLGEWNWSWIHFNIINTLDLHSETNSYIPIQNNCYARRWFFPIC